MSEEVEVQESETPEVQAESVQEQPQEQVADRPDWLPEKFDRPEELANSYRELERAFYTRKEDFRNQIIEELNEEASADAPVSPVDYEVQIEAPDGLEYSLAEDDPMLGWFKETAHSYGLSQDEFNGLLAEYVNIDSQRGPDWNVEAEALGEHAERRLERVDAWANNNLSENAYNAFANIQA